MSLIRSRTRARVLRKFCYSADDMADETAQAAVDHTVEFAHTSHKTRNARSERVAAIHVKQPDARRERESHELIPTCGSITHKADSKPCVPSHGLTIQSLCR
jgi:hypothetical protein